MKRGLAAALLVGHDPPEEYLVYRLCKLWGVPPSEARRQTAYDALVHLAFEDVENRVANMRMNRHGKLDAKNIGRQRYQGGGEGP